MATKKQRKRSQKERRHEYETVWVDGEGNELEEPPEDVVSAPRERRSDGRKPQQKDAKQRTARAPRVPQPPSWRRSGKRAVLLGAAVFAFVAITVHPKGGQSKYISAAYAAALFAALFIPYIYGIERFTYRRYQRKQAEQAAAKKPKR